MIILLYENCLGLYNLIGFDDMMTAPADNCGCDCDCDCDCDYDYDCDCDCDFDCDCDCDLNRLESHNFCVVSTSVVSQMIPLRVNSCQRRGLNKHHTFLKLFKWSNFIFIEYIRRSTTRAFL